MDFKWSVIITEQLIWIPFECSESSKVDVSGAFE